MLNLARQEDQQNLSRHIEFLQIVDTVVRVLLVMIIIIATELTIHWNGIHGVNTPGTVGQLIPLIIAIGAIGHLLLSAFREWFQKHKIKKGITITTEVQQSTRPVSIQQVVQHNVMRVPILYSAPVHTLTLRPSSDGAIATRVSRRSSRSTQLAAEDVDVSGDEAV
jgi:hypothetical protein